jgi:hypothetical protein
MVPHTTFPRDCSYCHEPEHWQKIRTDFHFDHLKETGFELVGAHDRAACLRCHNDRGPVKIYVERGCGGCHPDPHKAAESQDCSRCHNQENWDATGFAADHAGTRFPLMGIHAITPCESCHLRAPVGDYKNTPAECHLCHQPEVARAVPNHPINGWQRGCERCHSPMSWRAEGFNHGFFPLTGGHANLSCLQCHPNGRVAGTSPECFACHRNDYLNAPNHVSQNRSTNCLLCHNTTAWK